MRRNRLATQITPGPRHSQDSSESPSPSYAAFHGDGETSCRSRGDANGSTTASFGTAAFIASKPAAATATSPNSQVHCAQYQLLLVRYCRSLPWVLRPVGCRDVPETPLRLEAFSIPVGNEGNAVQEAWGRGRKGGG